MLLRGKVQARMSCRFTVEVGHRHQPTLRIILSDIVSIFSTRHSGENADNIISVAGTHGIGDERYGDFVDADMVHVGYFDAEGMPYYRVAFGGYPAQMLQNKSGDSGICGRSV